MITYVLGALEAGRNSQMRNSCAGLVIAGKVTINYNNREMSKLCFFTFMFVADMFFNYCCAQTKIPHHERGFIWYEVCEDKKHGAEDTLGNILVPIKYYSIGYHAYDKLKNGMVFGGMFWVVPFENECKNVYNRDGNHIITASQKYFDITKLTHNPFGTYYICRRRDGIKRTDILDVYGKTVCSINLYFKNDHGVGSTDHFLHMGSEVPES